LYPNDYSGRFKVYIRENTVPLSHIKISRYISNKYTMKILEMTKIHKYKIRVEVADAVTANILVKEPELAPYRVFIPANEVEINGIISLPEVSSEDLMMYGRVFQ
jgi:hypothetical protein